MPKPKLVDESSETIDTADVVEMVQVPFRGHDFAIPKDMDEWDTEACLAIGEKKYLFAAKTVLGPGQWALLRSLGSKRKDGNEFLTVFAAVVQSECIG